MTVDDEVGGGRLILRVLAGSRAHGLATDESDHDTRGVCIPGRRRLLGLEPFEQHEADGGDRVVFSLAKAVRLALSGNPNVLELLYTAPEDVLHIDAYGEELRAARGLFLTSRAGERFVRYGVQQLERMERHHRWLAARPPGPPRPDDFGGRLVEGRHRFPDADAQKAYKDAQKHWKEYDGWRRRRNPARAALEREHGYDTKHAMHLCRLLTMGREILSDGVVRVRRPDASWLRSVRDGALTYDELVRWAREELAALPDRVRASSLPEEPDRDAADALVVRLHDRYLRSLPPP